MDESKFSDDSNEMLYWDSDHCSEGASNHCSEGVDNYMFDEQTPESNESIATEEYAAEITQTEDTADTASAVSPSHFQETRRNLTCRLKGMMLLLLFLEFLKIRLNRVAENLKVEISNGFYRAMRYIKERRVAQTKKEGFFNKNRVCAALWEVFRNIGRRHREMGIVAQVGIEGKGEGKRRRRSASECIRPPTARYYRHFIASREVREAFHLYLTVSFAQYEDTSVQARFQFESISTGPGERREVWERLREDLRGHARSWRH